ncbi:MAG: hypothetical protein PHI24_14690 [Desulfitobacteriaceae bacterium]|nr:hypothetical protein [Desulfitobacteriaceae bacterium]
MSTLNLAPFTGINRDMVTVQRQLMRHGCVMLGNISGMQLRDV